MNKKQLLVLWIMWLVINIFAIEITIGTGNETSIDMPVRPWYEYNYSQQIYYQSEINVPNSQITSISFYWDGYGYGQNCRESWVVYIGHTNKNSFSSTTDWEPITILTQVYSGSVNIPNYQGWVTINLSTPFLYNNTQNLIIAVDENQIGSGHPGETFHGTATPSQARSLVYGRWSGNPDPANPPNGQIRYNFANIKFNMVSQSPDPLLYANPIGSTQSNIPFFTEANHIVRLGNAGNGSFTINNITISGDDEFSIVNLPTLPLTNLTPASIAHFSIKYLPMEAGSHSATVSISNSLGDPYELTFTGQATDNSVQLPFTENFEGLTFPPTEPSWADYYSIEFPVSSGYWYRGLFGNAETINNYSANMDIYYDSQWLVTPLINLGISSENTLEFDIALTAMGTAEPADPSGWEKRFVVAISDEGGFGSNVNVLKEWDNFGSESIFNNISMTGDHVTISLSGYSGYRKIGFYVEASEWNALNTLSIDNVVIHANTTLPVTLTSFNGAFTISESVNLQWTTESEINLQGYNLYKGETDNQALALKVNTGIITAMNQSGHSDYLFVDSSVEMDKEYYYWLQSVEMDGSTNFYGQIVVKTISTDPSNPVIPLSTKLTSIYPNPFNPSTTISFELKIDSHVSISIFNSKGQLIKTIANKEYNSGKHIVVWDGLNKNNQTCSSGIYYCKMQAGEKTYMKKMMLIK